MNLHASFLFCSKNNFNLNLIEKNTIKTKNYTQNYHSYIVKSYFSY